MVLEADFLIPQTFHVLPPPHENLDTHKSQGTSRTQLPESPASTPPEARGCGVGGGGGGERGWGRQGQRPRGARQQAHLLRVWGLPTMGRGLCMPEVGVGVGVRHQVS